MGQEKNWTIRLAMESDRELDIYWQPLKTWKELHGSVSRTESDGGGGPKESLLCPAISLTFLTGGILDLASSISAREKSWKRC